jgi:PAS domain S-box-containing protein
MNPLKVNIFNKDEGHWLWLILDVTRDGICIMDQDYRLVECNISFAQMLGYRKEELIGLHVWDWDANMTEEQIRSVFQDNCRLDDLFETRHRRKDGSVYDVEITLTGTSISGQILVVAVCRDITVRKKQREALLKTQFAMDLAKDGCIWVDEGGRIVYANNASLASLGYTRDELSNLKVFDIDPDFPAAQFEQHKQDLLTQGSMTFESRHIAKDGRIFPVEVSTNFLGDKGKFLSCAFDRDITERKEVEKALRESYDLLEKRVEERTAQLIEEIEQRKKSQNELSSQYTFQEIIADIAAEFVSISRSNLNDKLLETLKKIGAFIGVDRSALFLFSPEATTSKNTLEWCGEGIGSGIGIVSPHPILDLPSHRKERLRERAIYHYPDMDAIPAEFADRKEALKKLGIQSSLFLPIVTDKSIFGMIGFEWMRQKVNCSESRINGLRVVAQIIGNALGSIEDREALLEAKASLEQRVNERTRELQEQVTAKEKALADLAATQSSLFEASRFAGMAEVATGVLHNVGNVLNSVNVSCNLIMDQLRHSRIGKVSKLADMVTHTEGGLIRFLSEDPKGRQIPAYLTSLASALLEEQQFMVQEVASLHDRIGHIKEIVAMQQSYSSISGANEAISPEQLLEDALKLNAGALARHRILVKRDYEKVPAVMVDKHKILQILVNLINNADHACAESTHSEKHITLQLHCHDRDRFRILVIDNGIGILPEDMTRIFQHGFTTRKSGHGFGLHNSALAARELGGSLSVYSDGPGQGATFTLELPCSSGECE